MDSSEISVTCINKIKKTIETRPSAFQKGQAFMSY